MALGFPVSQIVLRAGPGLPSTGGEPTTAYLGPLPA